MEKSSSIALVKLTFELHKSQIEVQVNKVYGNVKI